ncbi:ATP-binding protein [Sphingobium sufflavum]|uniref:ATP-binding protein n=1 Tax=Sphingobium sufflavum TaxID=1129547 RepID=UPI001F2EA30A|nr:ATP-binding protein [Sphingobium sufflavum]MCE7795991.1 ATP-binding protein [Sphingobium sufflavum]
MTGNSIMAPAPPIWHDGAMTDRPAPPAFPRIWRGPPLLFQILALLIGGLLVAQVVTLFLTLVLPPPPTPRHRLEDIAMALRSGAASADDLQRSVQVAAPAVSGSGWLVPETATGDLAKLVDAPRDHVRLFFYSPAPFAQGPLAPEALSAASLRGRVASLFVGRAEAQQGPPPGGMPGGGAMPGGWGAPMGGPMQQGMPRGDGWGGQGWGGQGWGGQGQRSQMPGQGRPAQGQLPQGPSSKGQSSQEQGRSPQGGATQGVPQGGAGSAFPAQGQDRAVAPRDVPVANGQSGPPAPGRIAASPRAGSPSQPAPPYAGPSILPGLDGFRMTPPSTESAVRTTRSVPPERVEGERASARSSAVVDAGGADRDRPAAADALPSSIAPLSTQALSTQALSAQDLREQAGSSAAPDIRSIPTGVAMGGQVVEPVARATGLFGLAPAPYVQGNFVAGLRLPDGRWSVVQLAAEPFPNTWQRRILLWFLCALALVTPLGWIFARRLVKPLIGFAQAAEQLGRDPTAPVLALGEGPAEVGRAARAFNQMQTRLRSFVDDRTAMVGAISHDLRTPLTRLRFRIEDVDDDATRDGMIAEVEEMEAMISSVLEFIHQGSTPAPREYVALPALVAELADSWRGTGAAVSVAEGENGNGRAGDGRSGDGRAVGGDMVVDVDRLAVRRLIDNLVENAIKYGALAKIRVWNDGQEAFVDVVDAGAGVAPDEQDRVFEPFYRTAEARASAKAGNGLGLAVCRSIARTHGGDVGLLSGADGFTARLRLPLAFERAGRLAA